jgi:hypothetical protein
LELDLILGCPYTTVAGAGGRRRSFAAVGFDPTLNSLGILKAK